MQRDLKKQPLRGIVPPMATLLLDDTQLDTEGTSKLINHLLEGGVHGIFILGTTGECTNISYKLRRELISFTCKEVDGKVPVLVGVTDTSFHESLRLAGVGRDAGADAVVAAPPYYYGLGEKEVLTYFRKLADELPLPLYLYNMPSHTKTMLSRETVLELSEHPNILGLKDSSGQAVYFNSMLYAFRNRPGFSLLVGPEEMLASCVLMGGHGGVSGGANLFPKLYVDLYNAAETGNLSEVARLQELVMEISAEIYSRGSYGSSFLKGLKASMNVLGFGNGFLAFPLTAFEEQQIQEIKEKLPQLGAYRYSKTK
ncbi:dihydrodipicolinate synthase family protein [Cyclobacterium jeungdonense]|uniref:Dihydrodipicolinate synthase family protein n=1 Tax=Cyclobacterium jeungdonense TaxID=708087 RepID=A0ABT8C8T4_9BACT|nr:dihydrodipicolinate synthase family protein [Cyclobacterium jeungdonense]MDN3688946.1 dihydrodipicolinate synthase family protein [Cyclobacterium jeungdonense]